MFVTDGQVFLLTNFAILARQSWCAGRNKVRWHLGQETSLAPPCSNLQSFRSKYTGKLLKFWEGFLPCGWLVWSWTEILPCTSELSKFLVKPENLSTCASPEVTHSFKLRLTLWHYMFSDATKSIVCLQERGHTENRLRYWPVLPNLRFSREFGLVFL